MTDNNGLNSIDNRSFLTDGNISMEAEQPQDGEGPKIHEKAGEYMRELLSEKIKLNVTRFPISTRLIDQEVTKIQTEGRAPFRDSKYVDVYREKPTKVTVKVLVPIKDHPKFNFVGKILGPKGNTMKQLQEDTMCKMAVLGRGSMRDRQKEEDLRNSLDPKYAHLSDDLHVEISAIAPPAEAHARIAYALAEVKKYLTPDTNDSIWMTQMRDMDQRAPEGPHGYREAAGAMRAPHGRGGAPAPHAPRPRPHPHPHALPHPAKNKVISILDRARTAMESSYDYADPYAAAEHSLRGPPRPESDLYYERSHERFYEDDPTYYKDEPRDLKPSAREVGTRRPAATARAQYARPPPYARPAPRQGGAGGHKKRLQ